MNTFGRFKLGRIWNDHQFYLILMALTFIGLWLRIRNLGVLSLIGDEGIEILAVNSILQHGIPRVESGLVYLRWPLFLYIQAGFAYLFELNAFWLRFPSALFGAASVIPAYILARDLFNKKVALLVAFIMVFSVWGIELSRYARGYTVFQFLFLVSVILFYRGFILGNKKYTVWFVIAALFTLATHALSDLLITLFLIPLMLSYFTSKQKVQFSLWGVGVGILIVIRRKFSGFHLPENLSYSTIHEKTPDTFIENLSSMLGLPDLILPDFSYFNQISDQNTGLFIGLLLLAAALSIYIIKEYFNNNDVWKLILPLLVIWLSSLYQFGLVVIVLAFFLMKNREQLLVLNNSVLWVTIGGIVFYFLFWVFYLFFNYPELSPVMIFQRLFGFPDLYGYMFSWLVDGWPLITIALLLGTVLLFVRFLKNSSELSSAFLLGALYLPALAGSVFESYQASRYFFHLYPLIIIIFSWIVIHAGEYLYSRIQSLRIIPDSVSLIVVIIIGLFLSQDANPIYAWNVGSRDYQSAIDKNRSAISWSIYSYFHQDLKSPSLYVKDKMLQNDKVMVIAPEHIACIYHYYIGNVDYYISAPNDIILLNQKEGREYPIHYITNSKVLGSVDDIKQIIDNSDESIWLLGDRRFLELKSPIYSDEMENYLNTLANNKVYTGRDSLTVVVKIP